MYILDTNVISKMMSPTPDKKVIRWIDELESEEIWTTSISLYELQYGIEIYLKANAEKN
ncbi:PIN domain-containing protein [Lacunimicrobium album]